MPGTQNITELKVRSTSFLVMIVKLTSQHFHKYTITSKTSCKQSSKSFSRHSFKFKKEPMANTFMQVVEFQKCLVNKKKKKKVCDCTTLLYRHPRNDLQFGSVVGLQLGPEQLGTRLGVRCRPPTHYLHLRRCGGPWCTLARVLRRSRSPVPASRLRVACC